MVVIGTVTGVINVITPSTETPPKDEITSTVITPTRETPTEEEITITIT